MNNKLYLECYSGTSGDMMVAALLDLGADETVLEKALHSLSIQGFKTKISRVKKSGLDACDFHVILDSKHENHDHYMECLYGKKTHHHDGHHHNHTRIEEIYDIIDNAQISDRAKKISKRQFDILAKAEAKAHGVSCEEVRFHEVGAVDSIVDVISAAVCLDNLGIEEVIIPVLYEGTGFVKCQHGVIPIPVPAVSNIASDNALKLHIMDSQSELVTPTGAALVAAIKTSDELPEKFSVQKIGMGAGKRKYEKPSILRAMLIKDESM